MATRRGEARRRRRERRFLDALQERVDSNPEELVEQLLASPPGAVKAAALLERAGGLVPAEPEPAPDLANPGAVARGLGDVVRLAYELGQHELYGLPALEELEAWVRGAGGDGDDRSPVPARAPLTVAYYGMEGDVQETHLPDAEEVAALEAECRTVLDEIQRRGVAAVRGEIAVDPYPGAESRNPASSRAPLPDLGGDEGSDGVS